MKLLHSDLTEKVIGVFFEVYNELGHGFAESVYQKCMVIVLRSLGLDVQTEVPIEVYFRGHCVGIFHADLVVNQVLLVELKSASSIAEGHVAQTLNYLRATKLELALVLNFAPDKPSFKRLVLTSDAKQAGGRYT